METQQQVSIEIIGGILLEIAAGHSVPSVDQEAVDHWTSRSPYNKSIYRDINSDEKLRSDLQKIYQADKSQFWNVIISHRTALHSEIKMEGRNMWQRMVFSTKGVFRLRKRET